MEFGPDGCLYVADWYNKIVSHNEVATSHPDRDKSHGRIWRIRHKSQIPREIPNFYEVKTSDLVGYLKSPSIWAKRAAWHQISDRPNGETRALAKDLILLVSDIHQDEITRIMALWSLEGIGHYDHKLMAALLDTESDNLRREVVRSLQSFPLSADTLAQLLERASKNDNPMVRSQVLRTLDAAGTADPQTIALLVGACNPLLEGNDMGGAYERNFERYLARKALENYPKELLDFLKSSKASQFATSNLIWAGQALPKEDRETVFMDLWKKADNKDMDEPTFIIVAGMLDNMKVRNMMRPVLENMDKAKEHVSLTLKNLAKVQSKELTNTLIKPIGHLLKSADISQQNLGLKAIGKLGIISLRDNVVPFVSEDSPSETIKLAMLALVGQPEKNMAIFERVAKMETLELDLRTEAIQVLAKVDIPLAGRTINNLVPGLDQSQKQSVTRILSNSEMGSTLLKQLFETGAFTSEEFDLSSAEKVFRSNQKDARGIRLFDQVKNRIEDEKKAFESKLQRFMAIAEKGKGNPENGKILFQTCLMCHRVGDQGQDFAPALDGSALRENEALLTAILDPDAAVEGSYVVYRVTKKDGSSLEGYLVKRDNRGTTIGFMGGGSQFVQVSDIDSEGFLGGRSFMPKGLIDNYSEEQVSDLLAFIKTLK
jgi:putative heme-binding domain-containing protein